MLAIPCWLLNEVLGRGLALVAGTLWLAFAIHIVSTGRAFDFSGQLRSWPGYRVGGAAVGLFGALVFFAGLDAFGGLNLTRPDISGTSVREETELIMKDGSATVHLPEGAITGQATIEQRTVTDTEVLEVRGRDASKIRLSFVTDLAAFRLAFPGQPELREFEHGPFEGRSLLLERVGGSWKKSLIGEHPTPRQTRELTQEWHVPEPYPDRGLRVGESWKVEAPQLRRLTGMHDALAFQGSATLTLGEILQHGGETCALISLQFEIMGRTLDENNQEAQVELAGVGTVYRSLSSYLDVGTEISGQVKVQKQIVVDGSFVQAVASGPITMRGSQRRR